MTAAVQPRKKKRKYQPRQYHYDGMDEGVMSMEEHVAVELMGDVVTINVKAVVSSRRHKALGLASLPWVRGSGGEGDPGYVIQMAREELGASQYKNWLTVVRGLNQRWQAEIPMQPGEYRFRFRHDDQTVVVLVKVKDP